jgi:hypothetical protein
MVFTIIASGYHPRCALDATDGAEVRLGKIAVMIGDCAWGIHDLSRVEVADGEVPRFNMPMELGLHLGARLFGEPRHRRKRAPGSVLNSGNGRDRPEQTAGKDCSADA